MKVIDNFLSEEDFGEIEKVLMGANFAWHYNNFVAHEDIGADLEECNFQFTHAFYMPDVEVGYQAVYSQHFHVLFPILQKLPIKALWRVKSNMIPRQDRYVVHGYHVDIPFRCKATTAIFYVNTNNGYTIFKDGTKVESVANRLVSFDSQKLHSGSTCTDSKCRVTVNINYF